MKTHSMRKAVLTAGAVLALGGAAFAAVIFDPTTGEGFVGKGDVQLTFGWNNKALQDNANTVRFQVVSEVVTEVSWTCTNSNNDNEQVRQQTTTTTIEGLVESVARERRQVTGFILEGYDGDPVDGGSETDGPAIDSCPGGPWSLTTPAGAPVVVDSSTAFQVKFSGSGWVELVEVD